MLYFSAVSIKPILGLIRQQKLSCQDDGLVEGGGLLTISTSRVGAYSRGHIPGVVLKGLR